MVWNRTSRVEAGESRWRWGWEEVGLEAGDFFSLFFHGQAMLPSSQDSAAAYQTPPSDKDALCLSTIDVEMDY